MIFQIFRHRNNVLVEQFLNNVHQGLDSTKSLSVNQCISLRHLKVMQSFAQMRQTADDAGMGFAATFVTDDGQHHTTTNLPGVEKDLNILQHLLFIPFEEKNEMLSGYLRLVETQDGVQLQIGHGE